MQDHDQGKDSNKKRSIALKSSILQDSDSEEEECSDNEEDIAMIARKFETSLRKGTSEKITKATR